MRWDMYEVIIERPRIGGGRGREDGRGRMRARLDPESAPLREPISRGRGTKHLNENLAPLRRFLASKVGRPWTAVHREICATLRVDSAVQKHVLDHLRDMVHTRVVRDGDLLLDHGRWGPEPLTNRYHTPFYVCPDTGVLRRVPRAPRFRPPPSLDVVAIDSRGQYRRIGGVWYHITLAPLPGGEAWMTARDIVLGSRLAALGPRRDGLLLEHYGRWDRYAIAKRQLGKRELRQLPREVRR